MSQKVKQILTVVLLVLATVGAMWLGSDAINVTPVEGELPDVTLNEEADTFLVAAGITPFIMALLQLAKTIGWIPDGMTGKLLAIGQGLAYFVILVGRLLGADIMAGPSQAIMVGALTVVQFAITVLGAMSVYKGAKALEIV